MKKKQVPNEILIYCLLGALFLALGAVLFIDNWILGVIAVGVALAVAVGVFFYLHGIKSMLSGVVFGTKSSINPEQQTILASMNIPVLITDQAKKILWYNDTFREVFVSGEEDAFLEKADKVIQGFAPVSFTESSASSLYVNERHYQVYSEPLNKDDRAVCVSFFIDDTQKDSDANEYRRTKPCVILFNVDNYEELSSTTRESERTEILASVGKILDSYINQTNGILLRLSSRSYVAIVEDQHMESMISSKFTVLDSVREIQTGTIPITLSIGVGRGARTLYENQINARHALDMALGRGGDQAAVRTRNGYSFFGGISKAVEKRNKVRARIMANAISDSFKNAEKIIVMGHKTADLDALGSCVGITRIAQKAGTECKILFDRASSMAQILFDDLWDNGYENTFITLEEARDYVDENTLAVVVDCHTRALLDDPDLLKQAKDTVVIDHHRKMVGHIDNAVLFYLETSSSSCCEMVAEMVQYLLGPSDRLLKTEADALISGIMLDTKFFTVRTGVRTFEASSYLKTQGADTTDAKKYFATGFEVYKHKSDLIAQADIYRGCAIAVSDELPEGMGLVIPQTADELLNVTGIYAAIVAVKSKGIYRISARSLGAYNVQLIMEELGGGGHQTMAGAQIEGVSNEEIKSRIKVCVDKYLDEIVSDSAKNANK